METPSGSSVPPAWPPLAASAGQETEWPVGLRGDAEPRINDQPGSVFRPRKTTLHQLLAEPFLVSGAVPVVLAPAPVPQVQYASRADQAITNQAALLQELAEHIRVCPVSACGHQNFGRLAKTDTLPFDATSSQPPENGRPLRPKPRS